MDWTIVGLILLQKKYVGVSNIMKYLIYLYIADFENTVTSNKQAALSALDEVDSINALIDQAVSATNEAKNAMQGADTHAQLSLNVSRDAEKIAKEASEKASIIREKAAESKDSASELSSATQSLSVKLDQTKSRLEQKEEIAANDDNSASDALEKANRAQIKAQEASMKVEKAKKELEDISAILSTVQDPGNIISTMHFFSLIIFEYLCTYAKMQLIIIPLQKNQTSNGNFLHFTSFFGGK